MYLFDVEALILDFFQVSVSVNSFMQVYVEVCDVSHCQYVCCDIWRETKAYNDRVFSLKVYFMHRIILGTSITTVPRRFGGFSLTQWISMSKLGCYLD